MVKTLIRDCHRLAKFFHSSSVGLRTLNMKQNELGLKETTPPMDVITRWNSTHKYNISCCESASLTASWSLCPTHPNQVTPIIFAVAGMTIVVSVVNRKNELYDNPYFSNASLRISLFSIALWPKFLDSRLYTPKEYDFSSKFRFKKRTVITIKFF